MQVISGANRVFISSYLTIGTSMRCHQQPSNLNQPFAGHHSLDLAARCSQLLCRVNLWVHLNETTSYQRKC